MFTGIVQHTGRVAAFEHQSFGATLRVDSRDWEHRPQIGDSIAVNGCCLTVNAQSHEGELAFDIVHQTLRTTTLGGLKAGHAVNLEHAVTPQTMLGGHVVQGHVDGVAMVQAIEQNAGEWRVRIAPQQIDLMQFIVEKGSIAVDGVSLTVARSGDDWFEVALIPTTLQLTNLGALKQGDSVNLETDYIAKIVVNWMQRSARR